MQLQKILRVKISAKSYQKIKDKQLGVSVSITSFGEILTSSCFCGYTVGMPVSTCQLVSRPITSIHQQLWDGLRLNAYAHLQCLL